MDETLSILRNIDAIVNYAHKMDVFFQFLFESSKVHMHSFKLVIDDAHGTFFLIHVVNYGSFEHSERNFDSTKEISSTLRK